MSLRQQPSPKCPSSRELFLERSRCERSLRRLLNWSHGTLRWALTRDTGDRSDALLIVCIVGRVHVGDPSRSRNNVPGRRAGQSRRRPCFKKRIATTCSNLYTPCDRGNRPDWMGLSRPSGHWQWWDTAVCMQPSLPLAFTGSSSWQIWFDQDPIVLFWTVSRNTQGAWDPLFPSPISRGSAVATWESKLLQQHGEMVVPRPRICETIDSLNFIVHPTRLVGPLIASV